MRPPVRIWPGPAWSARLVIPTPAEPDDGAEPGDLFAWLRERGLTSDEASERMYLRSIRRAPHYTCDPGVPPRRYRSHSVGDDRSGARVRATDDPDR